MSVREYIGARYVPLFMGEWDNSNTYEPLSIVMHEGNSYTSRQSVPVGIDISNDLYWAETGNYNAQVEAYRQEVQTFDSRITAVEETTEENVKEIADIFPSRAISYIPLGQIVYEHHNGMPDHPGAICEDGYGQVIISSPANENNALSTENGHFRRVSITNDTDSWASAVTGDYGHANSICYSEEIGSLCYAPIWRYENGTKVSQNFVEKLSSNGAITGQIPTDDNKAPYAVSYDPIAGKTYAFVDLNDYLVSIYKYDNANNMFKNTGVTFNMQAVSPNSLKQDVAVYDGIFYAINTNGVFVCGHIDSGEIIDIRSTIPTNDMQISELAEFDGVEFNSNGILLSLTHSTTTSNNMYLTVASVIEIMVGKGANSYYPYASFITPEPAYTKYVDPNSTKLQCRGVSTAPFKSLYQLMLSVDYPCDALIQNNYNADLTFIYKAINLHPGTNVAYSTDVLRIGCDCSFGAGSPTGKVKASSLSYDKACNFVQFLNDTTFEFPENTNIASGHKGITYLISDNIIFTNTVKLDSITVENQKPYLYVKAIGLLNPA